jgi:hypothetical protein
MEEGCPVCWRSFSATLVPLTLLCGHSFCADCSGELTKCPLCRKRLGIGYKRITNYSLLSLLDRLGNEKKNEKKDQEVQTDSQSTVRRRVLGDTASGKPKQKPLVVKLAHLSQGLFKHLELKFK